MAKIDIVFAIMLLIIALVNSFTINSNKIACAVIGGDIYLIIRGLIYMIISNINYKNDKEELKKLEQELKKMYINGGVKNDK